MMNTVNYFTEDGNMNVVNMSEYVQNPQLYTGNVAIKAERDGTAYYLPLRSQTDSRPGVYTNGCDCVLFMNYPDEGDNSYSDESKLVDFSNPQKIAEVIDKQNQYRDLEYEMLCNPDDIFIPPRFQDDSPAIGGLKDATIAKHFDISKYQNRFGQNYNNDIRQYKKKDITLNMLTRICDNIDIEVEMIFRDKSPNVANPMGREISVIVTGQQEEGEQ